MKLMTSTFDVNLCDKKHVNEDHSVVSKKGYFGVFAHNNETKVELPVKLSEYMKIRAGSLNPLIYLSYQGDELWQRIGKEGIILGGVNSIAVAYIPPYTRSLGLLLEGESRTIRVNKVSYRGKRNGLVTVNTLYSVSMVEYEGKLIFFIKKDVEEDKINYKGKYVNVGYFSEEIGGRAAYYTSESFIQLEQGKDYVCSLLTPDGNTKNNIYTQGYVPVPKGACRLDVNSKMCYGKLFENGGDVRIIVERAKCAHLILASGYRIDTGADSVAVIPEKYARYIDSFDDDTVEAIATVNIAAEEQDFIMYHVPHLAEQLDFTDVFGMRWAIPLYPAISRDIIYNLEWKLPICVEKSRKFEHDSIYLSSLFNNWETVLYSNSEGYIDFSTVPSMGFYVVYELLDNGTAGKVLGCIMLSETRRFPARKRFLTSAVPFNKKGGERIFGRNVIRPEGLETIELDSPFPLVFDVDVVTHSPVQECIQPLVVGTSSDATEAERLGYLSTVAKYERFGVNTDRKEKTSVFTLPAKYKDGFVIKQVKDGEVTRYEWVEREVKFDATLNTLFLIPHNGCVLRYEVYGLDSDEWEEDELQPE